MRFARVSPFSSTLGLSSKGPTAPPRSFHLPPPFLCLARALMERNRLAGSYRNRSPIGCADVSLLLFLFFPTPPARALKHKSGTLITLTFYGSSLQIPNFGFPPTPPSSEQASMSTVTSQTTTYDLECSPCLSRNTDATSGTSPFPAHGDSSGSGGDFRHFFRTTITSSAIPIEEFTRPHPGNILACCPLLDCC